MLTASLLALLNGARGQGVFPKWMWLASSLWIIGTSTLDWQLTLAMWYCLIICTVPATNAMLSAVNGVMPTRKDTFQFLQTAAMWITRDPKTFGVVYGILRNLPILPVAWFYPWVLVLLGQSILYYLAGLLKDNRSTRIAEMATGAIIGLLV